jgi:uncharacterized membrane protein (DUF2068 family)
MALVEGSKGLLVLIAGLGLFALAYENIQSAAEELVQRFHLNPARRFPRIFLQLAANLTDQKLWLLGAAAMAYSLMRLIEACVAGNGRSGSPLAGQFISRSNWGVPPTR